MTTTETITETTAPSTGVPVPRPLIGGLSDWTTAMVGRQIGGRPPGRPEPPVTRSPDPAGD